MEKILREMKIAAMILAVNALVYILMVVIILMLK